MSKDCGKTAEDEDVLNNHRVILSGLERDRIYYYRLVGKTPEGKEVRNKYTGLLATVMQHEIDHLDGILFVDRLGFLGRSALSFRLRSLARTNKT